ncbi:hypothetical protein NEUTE1DRAFT_137086 [Neurospora tetrasperma FGSC 2508]|uniref:Uncharacterized protein n=1 Tax=Neurospora tetrasperma (strain FGSC 2508 / ATCC MYA-4615 / P0657) TaxID=510951 RepID=F8MN58_NEUT8|nr:uncharacterized protein NEUTE1DRAFT_137086 [Neurospora tetrasperma FGSC 2508]EGO57231.1 hypothetical protein NEUTE1DRAFT_137086 [Neurospora tetrasperma FGSC 2508]EGZ72522.1 hypothetical protein NEUTE2DRAFT_167396 [Neurospora tetrasperma FGSC 2509]
MPAVLQVRLFNEVGDADGLFCCLKNNLLQMPGTWSGSKPSDSLRRLIIIPHWVQLS